MLRKAEPPSEEHIYQSCPSCRNWDKFYKSGARRLTDGSTRQRILCRKCGYRFTENKKPKASSCRNARATGLDLQEKLQAKLEDLKLILKVGNELEVKSVPDKFSKLSGEVKGTCIYVYEETEKEALSTLKHEFLDYTISNVVDLYKQFANKLIALINEEAYERKEKLIEKLVSLLP